MVGTERTVLVCGQDERGRLYGRLPTQAPEIDGVVHLRGSAATGDIVQVRIIGARTYDLEGVVEAVRIGEINTLTAAADISTFPRPL